MSTTAKASKRLLIHPSNPLADIVPQGTSSHEKEATGDKNAIFVCMWSEQDIYFMELACKEAEKAYAQQEVPVGAVVTYEGQVIAQAHNRVQQDGQATAHADLLALQAACHQRGAKYLPDCTLYVTLEPCAMCAGACYWTQLGRLVFGAQDLKKGYQRWTPSLLHPKTTVVEGVCQAKSTYLLQTFFQQLR